MLDYKSIYCLTINMEFVVQNAFYKQLTGIAVMERGFLKSQALLHVLLGAWLPLGTLAGVTAEDSVNQLEKEPRAALVVGWSAYRGGSDGLVSLRGAHRDAGIVAEQLNALGYQVISLTSYKDERGQMVSNGVLREDLFDRLERLQRIFENHPDEGSVIFFFAGHGASAKGENYLLSYESQLSDIPGTGIPLQAVVDKLKSTRAKRQMLFIDACRDAVNPETLARSTRLFSFVPYTKSKGHRILFASEFGKQSTEYDELDGGHGAFSYFLWQGLRGGAARNGVITFETLANHVENEVRKFTLDRATLQEPHRAGEFHGEFFIAKTKGTPYTDRDIPPLTPEPDSSLNHADIPELRRIILAFDSYVDDLRKSTKTLMARNDPLASQDVQFAEQQARMAGETYLLAEQTYLVSQLSHEALMRYRYAVAQYQRAERNLLTAHDIVTVNTQLQELKQVLENRGKSMEDIAAVLNMTDEQKSLLQRIRERYELRLRIESVRPSATDATSTLYFERYLDNGIPVSLGVPSTAALHLSKNQGTWSKISMTWPD